ncbi:MAG: HDOD domain-containing protein [Myxococcota bacterium]
MAYEPSNELRERFEHILDLAPLPGSSPEGLRRLRDSLDLLTREVELHDLIEPLSADPALSAKVISLANSAFFARAIPVTSLELAAARIGVRRVRQLIFMQSASQALVSSEVSHILREIWQRSVAVAYVSETIASHLGLENPDTTFAAGLLHDLGLMIIADGAPELMGALLGHATHRQNSLRSVFQRLLDATPVDVAHSAAHQHEFPSPFKETMVAFSSPKPSDPVQAHVVHIARALSDDEYEALASDRTELAYDVSQALGLSTEALHRLRDSARQWIDMSRALA